MMIPNEIESINRFKKVFPKVIQKFVLKHPFDFKLRVFKKWALVKIEDLNFLEYNSVHNDQIYDATIMCLVDDKQINCPISINISKLIERVKNNPTVECDTKKLYELVHPDVKNEFFINSTPQICPPILLHDDNFACQLIDGNHRVVLNYRFGKATTEVIIVKGSDLKNCLEFNDFEVIIKIYSKLNNIIKRYK